MAVWGGTGVDDLRLQTALFRAAHVRFASESGPLTSKLMRGQDDLGPEWLSSGVNTLTLPPVNARGRWPLGRHRLV